MDVSQNGISKITASAYLKSEHIFNHYIKDAVSGRHLYLRYCDTHSLSISVSSMQGNCRDCIDVGSLTVSS